MERPAEVPGGGVQVGKFGGRLAHGGDHDEQALLGLTGDQRYRKRLEPGPRPEQEVGVGTLHVADVVGPAGGAERRSGAGQSRGDATFPGHLRPRRQRQRDLSARPERADEWCAPRLCALGQRFAAKAYGLVGVLRPQVESFSGSATRPRVLVSRTAASVSRQH